MRRSIILFLVALVLLVLPVSAWATDAYMSPSGSGSACTSGSPCATFSAAFSVVTGGATVHMAAGTYTGAGMAISYSHRPPSGSSGNFTKIVATGGPGTVIIDGQGTVNLLDGFNAIWAGISYIWFDGISWVRSSDQVLGVAAGAAANNRNSTYMKYTRCGFQNYVYPSYASYVLLEDCWITGMGSYAVNAFTCDHVVLRRVVTRIDNGVAVSNYPSANIMDYDSDYFEAQNVISIDEDTNYWTGSTYGTYGGLTFRHNNNINGTDYSATHAAQRGAIVLNCKIRDNMGSFGAELSWGTEAVATVENSIYYDGINGSWTDSGAPSSLSFNHNTYGLHSMTGSCSGCGGSTYGVYTGSTSVGDVSNSLFFNLTGTALNQVKSSNYNWFYGNTSNKGSVGSSAGDITSPNPTTAYLKYLPRMESGAPTGNDGKAIGAEVIWKYGVDGTFHGDAGYATLRNAANGYGGTSDQLWPWPYEDIIKTFFLTYGTGGSSPSNARGFTAGTSKDGSSQTLTKYIWEYLGNQIPGNIYASGSGGGSTSTLQGVSMSGGSTR
jgi:hypothetical protein